MQYRILVVDDDEIIRDFFETFLTKRGYSIALSDDGLPAVDILASEQIDLVISDVAMPNMDGLKLLQHIVGERSLVPVIMLTAYGTIENAVKAMKIGAFDYIAKPITDLTGLEAAINRALGYRRLLVENQQLRSALGGEGTFEQMVGPSAKMQRLFKLIESVAATTSNVLVTGPSGSGKELVAKAIHARSGRANGPFRTINCAAVPEGLIESELFGHEKGSFTGAYKTTKGKFESAHNGTLFLDEVGEMPMALQAKLLRVLESREIERVGGVDTVPVDVRLVTATNRDLDTEVKEGRFRSDLFYRINVFPIKLPPLAERREDIPILAHHFLRRLARAAGREANQFSPAALNYLLSAPWVGNVRELMNAIERAVVVSSGPTVELTDFFMGEHPIGLDAEIGNVGVFQQTAIATAGEPLEVVEKRHILASLRANEGRRNVTAEQLQISVRTLRNKLHQYRAEGEKIEGDDEEE